jgi:hypothetical protein
VRGVSTVSEKEWEKFFDMVDKIVNADGTAQEKSSLLLQKAKEYGTEVNLEELCAWVCDGCDD